MTEMIFRQHLSKLEKTLDCEIWVGHHISIMDAICNCPEKGSTGKPIIYIAGCRTLNAYYVALHELGHVVTWRALKTNRANSLHKWIKYFWFRFRKLGCDIDGSIKWDKQIDGLATEFDAWQWALTNALFPYSETVRKSIRIGIRSHAAATLLSVLPPHDPCWTKLFLFGRKA